MLQVAAQGQGRPPGASSILAGEVAISKFLDPDFDPEPTARINSECGYEFLMGLF
jgi:hypothetical protein